MLLVPIKTRIIKNSLKYLDLFSVNENILAKSFLKIIGIKYTTSVPENNAYKYFLKSNPDNPQPKNAAGSRDPVDHDPLAMASPVSDDD